MSSLPTRNTGLVMCSLHNRDGVGEVKKGKKRAKNASSAGTRTRVNGVKIRGYKITVKQNRGRSSKKPAGSSAEQEPAAESAAMAAGSPCCPAGCCNLSQSAAADHLHPHTTASVTRGSQCDSKGRWQRRQLAAHPLQVYCRGNRLRLSSSKQQQQQLRVGMCLLVSWET